MNRHYLFVRSRDQRSRREATTTIRVLLILIPEVLALIRGHRNCMVLRQIYKLHKMQCKCNVRNEKKLKKDPNYFLLYRKFYFVSMKKLFSCSAAATATTKLQSMASTNERATCRCPDADEAPTCFRGLSKLPVPAATAAARVANPSEPKYATSLPLSPKICPIFHEKMLQMGFLLHKEY